MKKFLCLIIISLFIFAVGCENKSSIKGDTPAEILTSSFNKEIKKTKDINKIATDLSKNDVIKTKIIVEDIDGYIPGFDDEILNYKKAVKAQPAISTIPFIYYIFETDKPNDLVKELKQKHNLRWNICVEADEMKISVKDNYVFFIMSPKKFDE